MSYESLIRLLGAIPPTGWHGTASIHQRSQANDHKLSKRSVERNLAGLAEQHFPPIERRGGDGRGKAMEWRWKSEHPLKAHAHREGVIVEKLLLHRLAGQLLPPQIADRLAEDERRARSELAAQPDGRAAWWIDHVAALPPGPQRFPKALEPDVFDAVSNALWNRRKLEVEYRNRTETGWRPLTLHPQGLVQDGYLLYLVAMVNDYTDPRHLSLARMRSPRPTNFPARIIPDFDFRKHVARQFDWPYDEPQPIEFWIHADRRMELHELPISADQQIDPTADAKGFHRVTATLAPNHRLDTFLRGFGRSVRRTPGR